MATPRDDYDTPWKDAVTRYFSAFMAFYFPQAHAQIDWSREPEFLEQELAQVMREAELGKRVADKLAKVTLLGGAERWVLVHLEVQGRRECRFAERMFVCNYRIYDHYRRPVASLALLADGSASWKPDTFGYRLFGCEMRFGFPVVKLSDYAGHIEQLLRDENPFALVTAAHLLTRQTKGDVACRAAAKRRLFALLFQRTWDKQRIIDFLNVIDWMMQLPAELNNELWADIPAMERSNAMPYMSYFERKFRGEGEEIGRREGRQEGLRNILKLQLEERFGALSKDAGERLAAASDEQLLAWGKALLRAPTLEHVFLCG
ncbi:MULTISPECIES: DUF4351 domain-containing protein [unclassified Janthinobacterium]|uniref:DUF4351 domain-containing protein n=1 Tax=unclassified Janthinobacterium TaxID=2610881 RepID=UPI00034DE5B2|nr:MULTISPECIES: DUF4351 domain-containing protein [unclassified Janthinobacterium]MEC5159724.1 hypothetical protein [Janthinobacterium sp. CG_S6]